MEPIDYTGALRRSWRLLIVLALVGAVVAVLLPVSKTAKSATGAAVAVQRSGGLDPGQQEQPAGRGGHQQPDLLPRHQQPCPGRHGQGGTPERPQLPVLQVLHGHDRPSGGHLTQADHGQHHPHQAEHGHRGPPHRVRQDADGGGFPGQRLRPRAPAVHRGVGSGPGRRRRRPPPPPRRPTRPTPPTRIRRTPDRRAPPVPVEHRLLHSAAGRRRHPDRGQDQPDLQPQGTPAGRVGLRRPHRGGHRAPARAPRQATPLLQSCRQQLRLPGGGGDPGAADEGRTGRRGPDPARRRGAGTGLTGRRGVPDAADVRTLREPGPAVGPGRPLRV